MRAVFLEYAGDKGNDPDTGIHLFGEFTQIAFENVIQDIKGALLSLAVHCSYSQSPHPHRPRLLGSTGI